MIKYPNQYVPIIKSQVKTVNKFNQYLVDFSGSKLAISLTNPTH